MLINSDFSELGLLIRLQGNLRFGPHAVVLRMHLSLPAAYDDDTVSFLSLAACFLWCSISVCFLQL